MMPLPIRARLTLWYAVLLGATIIALSVFLVLQLRHDLRATLDDEIRRGSVELARAIRLENEGDSALMRADFEEDAHEILSPPAGDAQLIDRRGGVIGSGELVRSPPLVSAQVRSQILSEGPRMLTVVSGGQSYRVRAAPVPVPGGTRVLVVAGSLRPVEEAEARVVNLLLVAMPAAVLLTCLLSYWLAGRALRPIDRMARDAEAIGIERLHERVEIPPHQDETRRLALTLNAMLDRIETGVQDKRRLVADASHELRTPLAVMRSELDVALRGGDLAPEQHEVLLSVRDEVDRITRIVTNIVTLSQVDEGRLELLTTGVDVRDLVERVRGRLQPLAEAKGVTFALGTGGWRAQADAARLELLVTNLVENAIKFSPDGGAVRIEPWRTADEVGLTVADSGPGIPAADRDLVFERFYRSSEARDRGVVGSGLGLAICQEIARAHGGRIWLEPHAGGGNVFSVALPGWRADTGGRRSVGASRTDAVS